MSIRRASFADPNPTDGFDGDVAVGVFGADGDGGGLAGVEVEVAERREGKGRILGSLVEVKSAAIGECLHLDGDVGGAAHVGGVGDGEAVVAGAGDLGLKADGLCSFAVVEVVVGDEVALIEAADSGLVPEALLLGLLVEHGDVGGMIAAEGEFASGDDGGVTFGVLDHQADDGGLGCGEGPGGRGVFAVDRAGTVEVPVELLERSADLELLYMEADGGSCFLAAIELDGDAGAEHGLERNLLSFESGAELVDGDVLHGDVVLNREGGGEAGGLADGHEDGLHADGAVGDVRGGEIDRDEEVVGAERCDGAVGDVVGVGPAGDVAALGDEPGGHEDLLHGMGVDDVAADGDAVGFDAIGLHVLLGHDVATDHAAGLAHVERGRDVAVVGELVFGQAPHAHRLLELVAERGIVSEHVPEAEPEVAGVLVDGVARGGVGLGVVDVDADVVGFVGVGLAVDGAPLGLVGKDLSEVADVLVVDVREEVGKGLGRVVLGPGEGDPDVRTVGDGGADVEGLDAMVAFADGLGGAARHAGEGLIVLGDALATDAVGDVRGGHEVAFVGGIDEDASGDGGFRVVGAGYADGGDMFAIEEGVGDDLLFGYGDVSVIEHGLEGLLRDVRLEEDATFRGEGLGRAFAVGLLVGGEDATEELRGEAADGLATADVGLGEAASDDATDVL